MITNSALAAFICVLALDTACRTCLAESINPQTITHEPITPIPALEALDPDKLALGKLLFNDPRLSADNSIACASCHHLESGGDDELPVSLPVGNHNQKVNTPSIFNARFNFRQNWDGSSHNLADQLDTVVRKLGGGDTAWDTLLVKLNQDEHLSNRFSSIYHQDHISRDNYTDAMIVYLDSLTTPNARFDRYLRGEENAIDNQEVRGYTLFKEYGCISCHQGINVGGNLFQRFGIFYDYFRARGDIHESDYGRMNVTGKSTDKHVFKVPSLRNVELTAPYLHDGQVDTLEAVVAIMARTQLGVELDDANIELIVKFLKTLTGETGQNSSKDQG